MNENDMTIPACLLCGEPVTAEDRILGAEVGQPQAAGGLIMGGVITGYLIGEKAREANALMHVECGVRSILGGIGHHQDHSYWCDNMHDDDAGLGYRESSRQVYDLFIGGRLT